MFDLYFESSSGSVQFRIRAELNAKANNEYKLSLNDFIIKAAAIACRKVPEANSEWRSDDVIRRYHSVDINVAVNTDRGLFTPVIKDADLKGLATISNLVKEFVKKAQDNKLTLEDLQVD
jgi:pyruvate dehydrogenase E2 component (dihydrolipoamide acetyltransferase)